MISQAGRACSLKEYKYCDIAIGKKSEIHASKDISGTDQNELPNFRRKYRARGIQVIQPAVTRLSFIRYYDFAEFTVRAAHNNGVFVHDYVPQKRGPPISA